MDLKIDTSGAGIGREDTEALKGKLDDIMESLWSGKQELAGWVRLPMEYDKDRLEEILFAADRIQAQCDLFIVIGVGGSYLGARAVIEALGVREGCPEIRFAGNNLSGTYHGRLLLEMGKREVCLCVISKSGGTLETDAAFQILREALIKKYGSEKAARRIYVVTDPVSGSLRKEVLDKGYVSFPVPCDIGGRYSVLTAVGMLPMAVAGIDIKALLRGADDMASDTAWDFDGGEYAAVRYAIMNKGKTVEIFQYYEPQLQYFVEWLKQLFGESEGKEGKGLFPVGLQFTADLHSMGQFIQEGNQIFFETVLNVISPKQDVTLPESAREILRGRSLNSINQMAVASAIKAHGDAGVPVIKVDIPELNEFHMGQLIYFFEMTCALTASLMGVNPFNQPGVERYKTEMRRRLESCKTEI